jgi:hypothetical protein
MNRKCPQCNSGKDPSKELTKEGLVAKLLKEVKKDNRVKDLIDEFKESRDEYAETLSQFKKDIKKYIETRGEELCISEKRKYMIKCLSEIQSTSKTVAKEKSLEHQGALVPPRGRRRNPWNGTPFDQLFFGRTMSYTIHRLKHPYIYLKLF